MAARKQLTAFKSAQVATVFCDTTGCEQRAFSRVGNKNLCRGCQDEIHRRSTEEFCKANNLNTGAEMRTYCMRLARQWSEPSFDRWCRTMTQRTVDILVRSAGLSDQQALDRLRRAGVIDGNDRLIPAGDARKIAAEAHVQERARRICETEAELRARGIVTREPGQDDEGPL